MADKKVFTSKDIERAFGISNREQVYWVDQEYLEPDIQAERPRLYSTYSAVMAGSIKYFEEHGYKLERAHRLSELALALGHLANAPIEGVSLEGLEFEMVVVNAFRGFVLEKDMEHREPLLGFILEPVLLAGRRREWGRSEVYSKSSFSVCDLLAEWSEALGGDSQDIRIPVSRVDQFRLGKRAGTFPLLEFLEARIVG